MALGVLFDRCVGNGVCAERRFCRLVARLNLDNTVRDLRSFINA
jgi:hypothetical protein